MCSGIIGIGPGLQLLEPFEAGPSSFFGFTNDMLCLGVTLCMHSKQSAGIRKV